MLTKQTILHKLKELQPLFAKEDVMLLGLFGSYSRDEADENSDIDILIETSPAFVEKNVGWDAFVKLDELREILQKTFRKKIDITDKQGLIAHHNKYILNKVIYV